MARFDDGELYVDLESATLEQGQRALVAARRLAASAGVCIVAALQASAKREALFEQEQRWEAGDGPEPEWPTDEENQLADIGEEALAAVQAAAGGETCALGLVAQSGMEPPAVRDLFEPA
jgi:hypothetical protein